MTSADFRLAGFAWVYIMVAHFSAPLLESWSWRMGSNIRLTAEDGHQLGVYAAKSTGPALAAVVVVQEIFGVNRHVRSVADDYASQGFWAIAPALFDRVEPNLELDYNPTDASQGMQIANQLGMEKRFEGR
jgi:carboxymethylenebutenolidase